MPKTLSAQGPSPKLNPNLAVVPDTGYLIPPHVMGRNIDDPTEDLVASGRRLQKPRLGVRVPYRNLTSQIVTQDEIAQEILQRSMRRNPAPPPPEVKDVFFAMKLTQRLAHRLTVPVKSETEGETASVPLVDGSTSTTSVQTEIVPNEATVAEGTSLQVPTPSREEAVVVTSTSTTSTTVEKRDKNGRIIHKLDPALERELALKQLNELPSMKNPRRPRALKVPSSLTPKKKLTPKKIQEAMLIQQQEQEEDKSVQTEMDQSIQTNESALFPLSSPNTKSTATSTVSTSTSPINKKLSTTTTPVRNKRQNNDMGSPPTPNRINKKLKSDNNNKKSSPILNGDIGGKRKSPIKVVGSPKTPKETKGNKGKTLSTTQEDDSVFTNEKSPTSTLDTTAGSEQGSETGSVKKRRSKLRELDMLLGDEGAVNMIYEAEKAGPQGKRRQATIDQSATVTNKRGGLQGGRGKSRGRPSNRSRTIKNRQDMLLKARLVRTAVLRLSSVPSGNSPGRPRARRRSSPPTSPSEPRSPLQSYPFPPKLPLAADASRIIRRHSSSSSFSSRSNSPNGSPRRDRSPRQQEPLQIIPGPNKKKGVPIFIKKVEKTYRGKKKKFPSVILPTRNTSTILSSTLQDNNIDAQLKSPKTSDTEDVTAARHAAAESTLISLEDDATLRALEQQLAAVVGEDVEPIVPMSPSAPLSPSEQALYAPSTSSGGVMKPPPNMAKKEDVTKQRTSVRQSAGTFCYREINIRRYSNLVQIILTPGSTKMKNSLNVQVLRELRDALQQLRRDESCRVVLLSSTGSSFCQGIDVHSLLHVNSDRRKKAAQELSIALKEFVKALATFSKPLVAAVHGPAVGLGVTMLPYFDMVFASDKATFYAPYAKLGQVPEGAVAITMPNLLGNAMASELLYGCRKLTASEALHCGLVTKILWPDKFQEELIPTLCTVATQSSQSMEAMKLLLRENLRSKLDAALDAEASMLVNHWQSNECQRSFKKLLDAEGVGLQRQRVDA